MDSEEKPDFDALVRMSGPGTVDFHIREAIRWCWILLPKEKRDRQHLEAEIRRLVDRAIGNLKEDEERFGQ